MTILSFKQVVALMPHDLPPNWIEEHWPELGGVEIGDKKLILEQSLYTNLERVMKLKQASDRHAIKFVPQGKYFVIGYLDSPIHFDTMQGFGFIHFLLSHPNQFFQPIKVYHQGKTSNTDASLAYEESLSEYSFRLTCGPDKKARTAFRQRINELKEKLSTENYKDAHERCELSEEIKSLTRALRRNPRDYKSQSEKARVNVTRSIKRSLSKIIQRIPKLHIHLNKHTIHTGDFCSYRPIIDDEPRLILHGDQYISRD